MKTIALFLQLTAVASAIQKRQLMPIAYNRPTITSSDPWQCVTENLSQYFSVPKPTGNLKSALESYGDELINTCTVTGIDRLTGCFPASTKWCGFATAAPTAVVSEYSSYARAASEWWAVHSSKAVELKEECPIGWWNAGVDTPSAMVYLNETIIFGGCYAQEHAGNKSLTTGPTRSLTMGPTATPRSEVSATTPKATSTALRNESDGRSKRVGWTIMGTGWIAAAVIGGW